jgi:long-chain acyl-CoA synthetase
MHVGHFLERNSILYRNKIALMCGNKSLTFGELKKRAFQLCNAHFSLGLSKGDRVAFLDYNSIEYVEFHLGLPIRGLITVPLNFRLVNNASCKVLIYRSSFAPVVEEMRDGLASVKYFICIDGTRGKDIGYEELLSKGQTEELAPPGEDEPAYILYTSGTTGIPKGAVLTQRNMLSAIRGNIIEQGIIPENAFLHVTSLFHIAPLQILLAFLYQGCTCVIAPQFDPKVVMELIQEHHISNIFLVPRMMSAIFEHANLREYGLSSLLTVAYGGAPTPPELLRKLIEKWGPIFLQVYGATEAGLITALRKNEHIFGDEQSWDNRLSSCGREVIDVQVKVVNSSGEEAPPGEVGEILVKSDSIMQGYWQLSAETSECIKDGWFYTGDLGTLNEDGYLFHKDRKKHMIISGGENIYPAEVENVLHMIPEIIEAAVIGVPDEKWGETVKAVVVLKEGQSLSAKEIIEFCKRNLAGYKKPTSVDFVQELPRNATGKVLKGVLRERYLH